MATKKLVPSAYTLSNTTYLTVSNADNMYDETDSTDYATIQHTRSSTTAYYLYIHGFNFNDIPSTASVTSFSIKIRAYESGNSTQSSYRMSLYNNTTSISNTTATASLSTSATTFTFPNGNLTWSTLSGYGNNFRIRVPLRRNSSSTAAYVYVYGAEIEVTYSVPSFTVTASSTAPNVIAEPSTQSINQGDNAIITFNVSNMADYTVTDNNTDVTSSVVIHPGITDSLAQTAESFTTGFSGGSNMNFYTASSTTGNNFNNAVGHTAESPGSTASGSGSWTYVKDNNGSTSNTGYADYEFDFSEIPQKATITSVQVKCYGAIENTSQSTSHADITLFSGNTQKSTMQKFTSTSNSIITISSPGTWTVEELYEAKLRFAVGYYGGHLFGITWTVTFTAPDYAEYTITNVATAHTVVISANAKDVIYIKRNGSWVEATAVYKKVNGSWVEQTDLTNVFVSGTNYRSG